MADAIQVKIEKLEYLIGLECGHFWPGDAPSDSDALAILGLFQMTGDTARCPRCGKQSTITGPVARVLQESVGGEG